MVVFSVELVGQREAGLPLGLKIHRADFLRIVSSAVVLKPRTNAHGLLVLLAELLRGEHALLLLRWHRRDLWTDNDEEETDSPRQQFCRRFRRLFLCLAWLLLREGAATRCSRRGAPGRYAPRRSVDCTHDCSLVLSTSAATRKQASQSP